MTVAVVTGASSGIGRAIARRLASDDARIVIADLRREPRDRESDGDTPTDQLIIEAGGEAAFVRADVTLRSDMEAVAAAAATDFGGLDIWVNNAGIWHGHRTILEETQQEFDSTDGHQHQRGLARLQAALRHMVPAGTGGSIVNIASIAGLIGLKAEPAYSASKGAVIALTRQLAVDHAADRVRVNAIAPGFVDTAMARSAFGDNPEHDLTPWPRLGAVGDVASAASFLASPASEWVTGTVLTVDGGYTAR